MNSATFDHPNVLLGTLLAKGGRAHRLARLLKGKDVARYASLIKRLGLRR